jgi:AraC family transcriptional regulator
MPTTCISTIDPVRHIALPVIASSNVVWSSGSQIWDGLTVELHRFNNLDMPEFAVPEHSLVVQMSRAIRLESKIGGTFRERLSTRGNVCIFSAGAPRQARTSQPLEVLVMTLSADALKRGGTGSSGLSLPELIEHHDLHDAQIENIALALKAEAESEYLSGPLYGQALSLALASRLLSRYATTELRPSEQKGGLAPFTLRRVVDHIHADLASDLRLTDLAKTAGLSPFRFSHNFKRATGLAPHQYVTRERIEHAKRMLRETDLSVTTVAFAIGCGSSSRFASLFRQVAGCSPSEYRASFR